MSILFVHTHLNFKPVLFQTIQFSIMSVQHSPRLQHYWNLIIRLFSVISRTLVWAGVLFLCRDVVSVFYSPNRLGNDMTGLNNIQVSMYLYVFAYVCVLLEIDLTLQEHTENILLCFIKSCWRLINWVILMAYQLVCSYSLPNCLFIFC